MSESQWTYFPESGPEVGEEVGFFDTDAANHQGTLRQYVLTGTITDVFGDKGDGGVDVECDGGYTAVQDPNDYDDPTEAKAGKEWAQAKIDAAKGGSFEVIRYDRLFSMRALEHGAANL